MARGFENVCEITSKSLAGAVYIEGITWWREDMNFIFSWQKQYLKYCFCHEKIKFISSSCRVMFFLLYRQKDIDKIIDFYSPKSNCDGSNLQYSNIRHCLQ